MQNRPPCKHQYGVMSTAGRYDSRLSKKVSVVAVVPTYNEFESIAKCVESLQHPSQTSNEIELTICVVNSGEPLPQATADKVHEIALTGDSYWTACTKQGVAFALKSGADYVLLANADTVFEPGSLPALLRRCQSTANVIACSPVYERDAEGETLLYSHQSDWGFLLYGKLMREPESAKKIDLTGGQGVLIPTHLIKDNPLDPERFPQYAGDHDLWLQLRKRGAELWLEPASKVINDRGFGHKKGGRSAIGSLWWRMSSIYSPDGFPTMWRLRRKHLGTILGLFSTLISFELRWTLGLPGILRRAGIKN